MGLVVLKLWKLAFISIPYVGFPKVLNALTVVKEVFAKKEDLS
ncbi:carboxymuconolactone decarboxylase [Lactiplantibacillus plantarum]|nr:carboxymuconolactone decarboxylase [Lactiplantibacillus plantarum]KZU18813.1 carboxymuconolactone decarboxylase [Lactiplantibacillus plantarum]KZU32511.1 carboxymuconolactone decarboxylase [Lactiplantibacillus plantarum]